jgi:hypothetical protein
MATQTGKTEPKTEAVKERMRAKLDQFRQDMVDCVLSLIPPDVAEHLGNSKKELLKAVRSMIDQEIEKTDTHIARAKELHKKS